MLPYAVGGMLAAMIDLVLLLFLLYPQWRNTRLTFGPDNEPWIMFMVQTVLPVILVAGAMGAVGSIGLYCWRIKKFQQRFDDEI